MALSFNLTAPPRRSKGLLWGMPVAWERSPPQRDAFGIGQSTRRTRRAARLSLILNS